MPIEDELCVHAGDGAYSAVPYLASGQKQPNLVRIARLRSNRVLYRPASRNPKDVQSLGHPTWYGTPFKLKEPASWGEPQQTAETLHTSRSGKTYRVDIQAWQPLLLKGRKGYPTRQVPLTLLRIQLFNTHGQPRYQRPLWLMVSGVRQGELSLLEIWEAYGRRYDIEHFFRFGKQRLLLHKYQTPEVEHEQNWWQIVALAYTQLWLAAPLAQHLPRPWESQTAPVSHAPLSPSLVQRDFQRLIRQIGTPAGLPKPRGKSPGRQKGATQIPRERQKVILKGKKLKKPQAEAA